MTVSALLETGLVDLRGGILAFAALQVATGLAWLGFVVPRERRDRAVSSLD